MSHKEWQLSFPWPYCGAVGLHCCVSVSHTARWFSHRHWEVIAAGSSHRDERKRAWRCACFPLWWELNLLLSSIPIILLAVVIIVHYIPGAFYLTPKCSSLLTTFIYLCCLLGKKKLCDLPFADFHRADFVREMTKAEYFIIAPSSTQTLFLVFLLFLGQCY